MRKILVDWLIDVHMKFKLLPETLFLTVNMIDRYCERNQVKRKNYQLLGVTSMLIASKYEEIYPPFVKDFIYITDKAYTKEQIIEMETSILLSLNFDLTFPTTLRFLERYSHITDCDFKLISLARYMLELCLVEISMNKWNPSLLVCSAIFVSKKILERRNPWTRFMFQQTGHQEKDVRRCAKELCFIINNAHTKRHYQAAFKKYSLPKFNGVAEICRNLSESIQQDEIQASTGRTNTGPVTITPYVSNRSSIDSQLIGSFSQPNNSQLSMNRYIEGQMHFEPN
jgi:cyclin B